ncbi:MAG: hypothetical protein ABSF98_21305 [Bryobacteraceae bacterium]
MLASVAYTNAVNGDQIADTYSYTAPGEISVKGPQITRNGQGCSAPLTKCMLTATLSLSYQYDSEGHRTQMIVPGIAYLCRGRKQRDHGVFD